VVSGGLSALVSKLAVAQPSSEEPRHDSALAVNKSTGRAQGNWREEPNRIQSSKSVNEKPRPAWEYQRMIGPIDQGRCRR